MKDHIQDIIIFILIGLIIFGIGLNYLSPKEHSSVSRANLMIADISHSVEPPVFLSYSEEPYWNNLESNSNSTWSSR